jgi:hypothetical protein
VLRSRAPGDPRSIYTALGPGTRARTADLRSPSAHRTYAPNVARRAPPSAPYRHFRVRAGDRNGQSVPLLTTALPPRPPRRRSAGPELIGAARRLADSLLWQ